MYSYSYDTNNWLPDNWIDGQQWWSTNRLYIDSGSSSITESPDEFVIDVKGFSKDELKVSFVNGSLIIKGDEKTIGGTTYSVNSSTYIFSVEKIKEINVKVENGLAFVKIIKESKKQPKLIVE